MLYLLLGENSYQALRKIREFKEAFSKKLSGFLIEELDGELKEIGQENFRAALEQGNLFAKTKLVIFKNVFGEGGKLFDVIEKEGFFLKNSKDIFVFWERELPAKESSFFKKYAEKIQEAKLLTKKELDLWLQKKSRERGIKLSAEEREVIIMEAGDGGEWALENMLEKLALAAGAHSEILSRVPAPSTSPFVFVEKVFSAGGGRALLVLKEAFSSGQEPSRFIYPLLWKAKQRGMPDAYFSGIQAESAMRRDPKNAEEILERFVLVIK